ncbi:MAG: glutamate formimidoyltransferase [Myxococcota bacterium]|nr:glutamate formimidoyltransferase [Myxococcota bacterium]
MKLVECVPNISEGRNPQVIETVAAEVETVDGVRLLDVDPGAATNRTVITFVGPPEAALEAGFRLIKKAAECIDMRTQKGAHARNGATDVVPFVPLGETTMEECIELARQLGERVGRELGIPVYLYEEAAAKPEWRVLANIRKGEYEALPEKLGTPQFKPDFGPDKYDDYVARTGATQIGARQFLIAYNINLNTKNTRLAKRIGLTIRDQGGAVMRDDAGKKIRGPDGKFLKHDKGLFDKCKATGWFIEEYGVAQVTMNLTDYRVTPPHVVFDKVNELAWEMGIRVTGSELVGLIPRAAMLEAGRYYLAQQGQSTGVPEADLVETAIMSMGLNQITPFNPKERIVEYAVAENRPIISGTIAELADELSRTSPAPGGGSVAALCGALAAGLAAMVANLTIGKSGYRSAKKEMIKIADAGQFLKDRLLRAVDDDAAAFNAVMACFGMPKGPDRDAAILEANKNAALVPLSVVETIPEVLNLAQAVAERGNKNSLSDAAVAVLAARTAAFGAYYNVLINLPSIDDKQFAEDLKRRADGLVNSVAKRCTDLESALVAELEAPLKN